MTGELDKIVESLEKSQLFAAAREAFYAIPIEIRSLILILVILAAIVAKWILPAWTNLVKARREK